MLWLTLFEETYIYIFCFHTIKSMVIWQIFWGLFSFGEFNDIFFGDLCLYRQPYSMFILCRNLTPPFYTS